MACHYCRMHTAPIYYPGRTLPYLGVAAGLDGLSPAGTSYGGVAVPGRCEARSEGARRHAGRSAVYDPNDDHQLQDEAQVPFSHAAIGLVPSVPQAYLFCSPAPRGSPGDRQP